MQRTIDDVPRRSKLIYVSTGQNNHIFVFQNFSLLNIKLNHVKFTLIHRDFKFYYIIIFVVKNSHHVSLRLFSLPSYFADESQT